MTATLYDRLGGQVGLAELLRHFYADVRQHALLGPIFDARIQNWPEHLLKIGEFWTLQTGGPSKYRGGFAAAHLPLGIGAEHFGHWLALWDINCQRRLAAPEAAEMSALAHQLAERLQRVLAGQSGLRLNP